MRFIPLLLATLALSSIALAAPQKPNIIVILADDYGYGSAGCYGADPKLIRTPNLDRLAREGRRFTDANTTSSVCSPTRYSVLTGRYCWRTSLTHEVLGTFSPLHIETTRLNMASLLKSQGYQTAAVGKWHLGYGTADGTPRWRTDYTAELSPGPLDIGFDYHFGVPSNHGDLTGIYVENRFVYGLRSGKIPANMKLPCPDRDSPNLKSAYTKDDTESKRNDPMDIDAPRRVNERVMPYTTDKAIAWLQQQKPGQPFFLYFTPVAVHNPVTPSKELAGQSAAGPYGDWIHELDRSVGTILDTLDKQGLADNTLVLFTSDNGGVVFGAESNAKQDDPHVQATQAGLAINGALRGRKHSIFQGGFNVPFIVRWPGKVPAGTVCNETISLADILATTAAIVGQPLPPAASAAEDSYNILPAILGQSLPGSIRPDIILHSADGVFAVRKGSWKWIEGIPVDEIRPGVRKARAQEHQPQLYNLKDDPAETKNVLAEHPEVAKELEAVLNRYRDGRYSRELPPPPQPKPVVTMPAAGPEVVLNDALDKVPAAPWVNVRGKWTAKDKAIWGTQRPSDQGPAAYRSPLAITDGDIRYEAFFPAGGTHALRIQCQDRGDVFHIELSPRKVAVVRQLSDGRSDPVLRETLRLKADTWYPVRVSFRGKEVYVQLGDATFKGIHDVLATPKIAFAFLVTGQTVGFRNVTVSK